MDKLSYHSASAVPIKLFFNKDWLENGKIKPTHLQLNLTNKCNLNCAFCSCKDRDKNAMLTFDNLVNKMTDFSSLGGQSVTITGGGEPLLHPDIEAIIDFISDLGIKIGLVTNGIKLHDIKNIDKLTWCRISLSHVNPIKFDWKDIINRNHVDWAFSYVFTEDYISLQNTVNEAKDLNITHFRVVTDINNPHELPQLANDSKVIYQHRTNYTQGSRNCWISLLKPYLDVDGNYYPCCSVQYQGYGACMPKEMCMGDDLKDIIDNQKKFDGSACQKCYYRNYNDLMELMIKKVDHLEFI